MITPKPLDPRSVWGKVLQELRKSGKTGLHVICVEIGDIKFGEQNDFVINVTKALDYETLKKSNNYADLVETFAKLGYNYNVVLNLVANSELPKIDKVHLLQEILGAKIKIKD